MLHPNGMTFGVRRRLDAPASMTVVVDASFDRLDYVYTPSSDVLADRDYFVDVLGGEAVFAIQDGATRVAAIRLTQGPPLVLLTDHLEGERPILV